MMRFAVVLLSIGSAVAFVAGCSDPATGPVSTSAASAEGQGSQAPAAGTAVAPDATADATPETDEGLAASPPADSVADIVSPEPSADDLELPPGQRPPTKEELAQRRAELDATVWKNERLAQEYEQSFVRMWDDLLEQDRKPEGDKFQVLKNIGLDRIQLGVAEPVEQLDWGIEVTRYAGTGVELDQAAWQAKLDALKSAGYRLVQSEWHHAEFDPDKDGHAQSTISMILYAEHLELQERIVVSGKLRVRWRGERDAANLPVPERVDASDVRVLRRVGAIPFQEIMTVNHATPETKAGVQPLLVQDLDGDGLSEIILAGSNQLFRNKGNGQFEEEKFCEYPEKIFETGLLVDINRDGRLDFVTAGLRGDLLSYMADENGRFTQPPIGKARSGGPLQQPQAITAGDIDGDGDLDLWVAQYKISYVAGQMPTPYYDANDGFPAFLLINNGEGRFEPLTEEAGLAAKRNRRTYSSSFIDIDEDRDLDLVVISDFSGVDVYTNDGKGYFTDITEQALDNRHLFGMAASYADFNRDGKLDFFVAGMASTTARRLEQMRLGRRDRPEIHMMRLQMGYGNRMYLGNNGKFEQPAFKDDVARTGWTWGTTAFDFDNDGDQDLFAANGHSSGKSTKDHCTYFWCHDIYDASSDPNPAIRELMQDVHESYLNRTESWDGYQKNCLLMNRNGEGFDSIAFLMGVGQQYDGRAVVSDDIDGDGRLDLLVAEDQWYDGQLLHVYRNQLESNNHWVGLHLGMRDDKISPVGARVTLKNSAGTQLKHIVNGDSIHAQHATTVHFGLGQSESVESILVQWPDGVDQQLDQPAIDQYHRLP